MPLKTYDTKEAVPEALRGAAVETADKKWVVAEAEKTDEDVAKLNESLRKEREDRKEAQRKLTEAETKLEDTERDAGARKRGVKEEDLQKIREDEAKKRKPLEDQVATLTAENRSLKLTDRVRQLGIDSGWMTDRVKQAMALVKERVDLSEDGAIIVVDDNKKATAEKIEDFLKTTFKKENAFLYEGTGAGGTHTAGTPDGEPVTPQADAMQRKAASMGKVL